MTSTSMAARAWQITLLMSSALLAQAAPAPASADAPTASLWSRMWRTPDQRGQALLQQGDAAGAAQTFANPEHKAHAALQAHDYASAAQTLSGIDTAEAHYNRGNALAHAGDLQGAINAYGAALKHNPQHTDALHNRDVVAQALKKQKDKNQDSKKQQDQDKKSKEDSKADDKPESKQDGKNGKPDTKPGDGKNENPADKPRDKTGDKAEPQPNDASGKKPSDKPDPSPPSKPAEPAASTPQAGRASAPAAPTAPAAPASTPKDDATQARRDAESALGKGPQPVPADAAKRPPTEKQIAQEQWLRAIPDDPGGLLRRKFLIEHMLRQQGQKP